MLQVIKQLTCSSSPPACFSLNIKYCIQHCHIAKTLGHVCHHFFIFANFIACIILVLRSNSSSSIAGTFDLKLIWIASAHPVIAKNAWNFTMNSGHHSSLPLKTEASKLIVIVLLCFCQIPSKYCKVCGKTLHFQLNL